MKLIWLFLFCLIVADALQGSANVAESSKFVTRSSQIIEQFGESGNPLLMYFVNQTNEEIEGKNNQIRQLQENVNNLQLETDSKNKQIHKLEIEVAGSTWKDMIIELLKSKNESYEDHIKSLKNEIQNLIKSIEIQSSSCCEKQNKEVAQLSEKIKSETLKVNKCESELRSKQEVIDADVKKVYQLETDVKRLTDKSNELESLQQQLSLIKNINEQQNHNLTDLNKEIRVEAAKAIKCETELERITKVSVEGCTAHKSTGVYSKTIGKNFNIEVLCNSAIAGPGWTVIQQRIRGGVDFNVNWETYRKGFGDFWDGDFFLGLENIHRLTTEKPHELYIHIEKFDGNTFYARYNEFAISGEDDQYRLKLGAFSGSIKDQLTAVNNMKFSTKDRDNDELQNGNLAVNHMGGWWYTSYAESNLNGVFFNKYIHDHHSINWVEWFSLKKVVMLIRPKAG